MKTKRKDIPAYKGWFLFRIKFLGWFPKWVARQILNNISLLMRRAGKDDNVDYIYVRHILSIAEEKEFRDNCIKEICKWIVNNQQDGLLSTLSDIYTCAHTVYIRTLRPGLWIGRGGETIDSLISHLRKTWPDIDVELVENTASLAKVYSCYTTLKNDY